MRLFGGTELVLQLTLESAPASGTVLLPVLVVLLLLVVLVVLVKVLGACVQNERLRHARGSRGAQSATIFYIIIILHLCKAKEKLEKGNTIVYSNLE